MSTFLPSSHSWGLHPAACTVTVLAKVKGILIASSSGHFPDPSVNYWQCSSLPIIPLGTSSSPDLAHWVSVLPPLWSHVPSSSLYSCPPSPVPLKTGIPQCPVLCSLFLFYIHHGAISSLPRCQGLAKNADVFPIYFSNLHLSPGHDSPEPNSQSQLLWLKNLIYPHIQRNFFFWGGGETKL